jgi:prepilin-type N-terminal cleavage/methylation domain-containing protein
MLKNNFYFIPNIFRKQDGVTLIELIVVIGILAILSVFIITTLNPYAQFLKAQDTRRKSDLGQIQKALEAFYQDNGKYPQTTGSTSVAGCSYRYCIKTYATPTQIIDWGGNWSPYMQILPKDTGGRSYVYDVSSDGQSYWLYASLQRGAKDPQVCNSGSACSHAATASIVCGGSSYICNYGVSSPNVSP